MKNSETIRFILLIVTCIIISFVCLCINYKRHGIYKDEEIGNEEEINEQQFDENVIEQTTESIKSSVINDKSKDWGSDDSYLLAKIAMAEAEGEGVEGKALVMCVVLNRVFNNDFPDSISEVIYEEHNGVYQFTPIGNGRFDNVEPDDECWEALRMIQQGWDESNGATYFTSIKESSSWHSRNLEFLFEYGGHYFYK